MHHGLIASFYLLLPILLFLLGFLPGFLPGLLPGLLLLPGRRLCVNLLILFLPVLVSLLSSPTISSSILSMSSCFWERRSSLLAANPHNSDERKAEFSECVV